MMTFATPRPLGLLLAALLLLAPACGGPEPQEVALGAASPTQLLERLEAATGGDAVDLVAFGRLLDDGSRTQFASMLTLMMPMLMLSAGLQARPEDSEGKGIDAWTTKWQEAVKRRGFGAFADRPAALEEAVRKAGEGDVAAKDVLLDKLGKSVDSLGLLEDLGAILKDMGAATKGGLGSGSLVQSLRVYRPDPSTLEVKGDKAWAKSKGGGLLRMQKAEDGRWFLFLVEKTGR